MINQLYSKIEQEKLWNSEEIHLKRNEFLKVGGTINTNLYYIISGALKIFIINDSEENIIRFGYKNNFISALDSFISKQPSHLYIQAIKKTTLKSISKEKLDNFTQKDIENLKLWNCILQELALQQAEREIDILTTSPKERFLRVYKRSPQLFQEIPSKYIASYLRMAPETLSRLKKY